MTRDEAISELMACDEYLRPSSVWAGTEDEKAFIVLDGRFTADQLEAFALIMRNEPKLFELKECKE